jgi:FixJ family two-component response regulator
MPPSRRIIAVIDDDESVRDSLSRLLRIAGYRCEVFANAETFLSVAAITGAAAVLCDIHLGGMTGLELVLHPAITQLDLPVVLMTGSTDPLIELPARELGAAFLLKPIANDKLLETIVATAGSPIADGEP